LRKEAIGLKVDNHTLIQNTEPMVSHGNPLSNTQLQKPSPNLASTPAATIEYTLKNGKWAEEIPPIEKNALVIKAVQNAVSRVQTSDAALIKIQSALQSGKKLALEAGKATSEHDKQALQSKLDQINKQIDEISRSIPNTASNKKNLSLNEMDVIHSLKSSWFESAENIIAQRYGLTGDGSVLGIELDNSNPVYLAAIDYTLDDSGKAATQVLHINVQAAVPATLPNGGFYPQYDDRVITHEMVHAIMGRSMNYESLPTWFKEGTAEFLPGADERIATNLSNLGEEGAVILQNTLGDGTSESWVNDSNHYSGATIAVRYLHDNIKANGHSGGIKDLLAYLEANPTANLDQGLSQFSSYKNVADFMDHFVKQGAGAAYINHLIQTRAFSNADVGAIGGFDADGGPVMTAESVIPDINNYSEAPLKHFKVEWPAENHGQASDADHQGKSAYAAGSFDSKTLGTHNTDIIHNPKTAAAKFDNALSRIAKERTRLDKVQKQLRNSIAQQNAETHEHADRHKLNVKLSGQSAAVLASQADMKPQRVQQLLLG
jgi:flagellin